MLTKRFSNVAEDVKIRRSGKWKIAHRPEGKEPIWESTEVKGSLLPHSKVLESVLGDEELDKKVSKKGKGG